MALRCFRRKAAGISAFIFQWASEPVGVMASVSERPVDIRQAARATRSGRCRYLTGAHEQSDRPAVAVAERVQRGVHAIFGAPDQATTLEMAGPASGPGMNSFRQENIDLALCLRSPHPALAPIPRAARGWCNPAARPWRAESGAQSLPEPAGAASGRQASHRRRTRHRARPP